jgi:hypothetical protein
MKKPYTFLIFTIGIIMVAFLPGCQKQKATSFLFTDTNCHYPCWHNITPGKTTSLEIVKLLSDAPIMDPPIEEPEYIPNVTTYTGGELNHGKSEDFVDVFFVDKKVEYLEFTENLSDSAPAITIKDMFDFFGKPDLISAISPSGGETRQLLINWVYPQKGVIITYYDSYWWNWDRNEDTFQVKPDLPVYRVTYFDPDSFDSIFDTIGFMTLRKDEILKTFQPWVNFGLIKVTDIH